MLEKHIDMTLVGKSYTSVLLSLDILRQGRKVLLLDDERMGMDELYIERMFFLEKEYLVQWGKEQDIEPLLNIDKYLTNISTKFIFDDIHLRLGESPAHSYRELIRKMPKFFSPTDGNVKICESSEEMEEFNDMYFEYCKELGKIAYECKDINTLNINILQDKFPEPLKKIYASFERSYQNIKHGKSWWKFKTLLYMSQGIFQRKLSLDISQIDRFHIFISLFSPFYELRQKKIFESLLEINLKKGGQFKKTVIKEWAFHKGKPWSVELDSYEGIIHPQKIAFVGGMPPANLVSLKPTIEHYIFLGIELEFTESPMKGHLNERIIFSGVHKLGTAYPLWEGTFEEKISVFKFIILAERGRKVDFVKKEIEKHLLAELEQIIPGISKSVSKVQMSYGRDVWIDKTKNTQENSTCSLVLNDFFRSEKITPLKNVYYFGPCRETSFGLLGTFMELNHSRLFT